MNPPFSACHSFLTILSNYLSTASARRWLVTSYFMDEISCNKAGAFDIRGAWKIIVFPTGIYCEESFPVSQAKANKKRSINFHSFLLEKLFVISRSRNVFTQRIFPLNFIKFRISQKKVRFTNKNELEMSGGDKQRVWNDSYRAKMAFLKNTDSLKRWKWRNDKT